MKKYLVFFIHRLEEFRLVEFRSVCKLYDINYKEITEYSYNSPFLSVEFESDSDVCKVLSRCVLVKAIYELYSEGTTFDIVLNRAKEYPEEHFKEFEHLRFRFNFETFGHRHLSTDYQLNLINQFSFMPLRGKISMKDPQVEFSVIEDYCHGDIVALRDPKAIKVLAYVYFGRLIGLGQRKTIDLFNLKKRAYIGTTSMDPELSLIMANMALVKDGSLVYDPFVGTGSFLLTCSYFGGYTFGSDIDGRQIRGKDTGVSIQDNVEQYKLGDRVVDTFACDSCSTPWRDDVYLDAIVTDPPYGVRAGAKRIGGEKRKEIKPEYRGLSYPSTVPYQMEDVIKDLVRYAARKLALGGRLVYWLPVIEDDNTSPTPPPLHPALTLIADSEQDFGNWSRRLITMEKTSDDPSVVIQDLIQTERELDKYSFRQRFFQTRVER